MYNYTVFGDVNEIVNDIISAFPAKEATELKKCIYNDINFDNMLKANEASIDENTGVGKLLEVMLNTVDANMDTNFAYINKSKGDVTKIKNFYTINASINFINKIDTDYHYANSIMSKTISLNVKVNNLSRMNDVYDILTSHKQDFMYGYKIDNNIIKNTYACLVCILVDLVCLNIIDVTEFMQETTKHDIPNADRLPYKINHSVGRNGRYLRMVDKLIKIFHDGSWNKLFKVLRTNNGKAVTETTVPIGVIIALIGAIPMVTVMIIYLIRFFISFYFETAVNIKQKAGALSQYITEVSKTEDDPNALYKQTKVVKILNNITTFISTRILKEDSIGMQNVQVSDTEIKTKAYVSDKTMDNFASSSNTITSSEIIFE